MLLTSIRVSQSSRGDGFPSTGGIQSLVNWVTGLYSHSRLSYMMCVAMVVFESWVAEVMIIAIVECSFGSNRVNFVWLVEVFLLIVVIIVIIHQHLRGIVLIYCNTQTALCILNWFLKTIHVNPFSNWTNLNYVNLAKNYMARVTITALVNCCMSLIY